MNERESGLPARESMEFDTVIVGARPVGLAAAIRLKQMAAAADRDISVVVIEKGSDAHPIRGGDRPHRACRADSGLERAGRAGDDTGHERSFPLSWSGRILAPSGIPNAAAHEQPWQLHCKRWLSEQSPIAKDLRRVRNAKPLWSRFGTALDIPLAGIDMWLNTIVLRSAIVRPASMRYWRDLTASLVSRLMPKTACIALGLVFDSN
jgi:glycine/D-amino acid oxidase-like deaminating enzyme